MMHLTSSHQDIVMRDNTLTTLTAQYVTSQNKTLLTFTLSSPFSNSQGLYYKEKRLCIDRSYSNKVFFLHILVSTFMSTFDIQASTTRFYVVIVVPILVGA